MIRAVVLLLVIFLSGCSSKSSTGESILNAMGFTPASDTYQTKNKIEESVYALSPEEEFFFGRAVSAKILSRYRLIEDESLQQYVNLVGWSVVSASPEPYQYRGYHFAVLDAAEVFAVSAPSGFVFISKGLLDVVSDEDQLAAILAHEISHVEKKHALRSISRDKLSGAVESAGVILGALNCNQLLQETMIIFSAAVDEITSTLLEKGYSRELEYEADNGAIELLPRVGYDQVSLTESLGLLELVSTRKSGGWFSTHPSPKDRIEQLAVQRLPAADSEGKTLRKQRFSKALSLYSSRSR